MNMFRTLRPVIVMALVGLALGACGVKSAPQHSADSPYPQDYPAAEKSAPQHSADSPYPQDYPAAEKSAPFITDGDAPAEPVRRRFGPASGIYQYPNPPSYLPPER